MSDPALRGRFVWHELLTTDLQSAAGFFGKVAGWKTQSFGNEGYTLFVMGKQQMAGLMMLPEEAKKMGAPPHWLMYVGTPNVDDTAKRATSLGGHVLKAPWDIPTVGRIAVMSDPQGAIFGIYTPSNVPGAETKPTLGDFSWHELATTDWKAAFGFYQKLFGWEQTSAMEMGPGMGTYQMFGRGGQTHGGMFNKPPQMPGPPAWLPYILVPDAREAADATKKLGGQIINGPMEVPGGDLIAQGTDLQGAFFAVHSVKPAAAAAKPAAAKKPAAKAKKKAAPAKKSTAATKRPAARKALRRAARKTVKKAAKKAAKTAKAKSKPAARKKAKKKA